MEEDNTVEITLATYGQMHESVQMTREAAEHYARTMIGRSVQYPANYVVVPGNRQAWNQFRVISTRLEDDNPSDPTKGRVVAICVPMPNRQMEVK